MQAEQIRRLVIGRRMLAGIGSNLTAQSDALAVAQAILLAHDAAELVISAIAESIGAKRTDKMALMDYITAVCAKEAVLKFPGRGFFESLNRERVSFKHYGILPNPEAFHRVVSRTRDYLDQACTEYLKSSLEDVDESGLLDSISAREKYVEARLLRDQGKYQRSLEALALAIEEAVRGSQLRFSVSVGDPNTTTALELTAYGVDPGAYIGLQEFLPRVESGENVHWDRRKKGHPANWTDRNVSFCLDTALDLLLKVQHAPFRPSAASFTMAFDDVLTAKQDGVLVHSEPYYFLSQWRGQSQFFGGLSAGQKIRGRVTPAYRGDDPAEPWQEWEGFEGADTFVVRNASSDLETPIPNNHVLVVRAEDFELSDEPSPGAKEFFPHLFGDEE